MTSGKKNSIKKIFESWNKYLEEDITDEQFENFKNFTKKIENYPYLQKKNALMNYALENFNIEDFVGKGNYKIVYKFNNNTVLKIADPNYLKKEILMAENAPEITPAIKEKGDFWILVESVNVIQSSQQFLKFFPKTISIVEKYFDEYEPEWFVHRISYFLQAMTNYYVEHVLESILIDSKEEIADNPEKYVKSLKKDLTNNSDEIFKIIVEKCRENDIKLDDIKLDNVGITNDGRFVIIDF